MIFDSLSAIFGAPAEHLHARDTLIGSRNAINEARNWVSGTQSAISGARSAPSGARSAILINYGMEFDRWASKMGAESSRYGPWAAVMVRLDVKSHLDERSQASDVPSWVSNLSKAAAFVALELRIL